MVTGMAMAMETERKNKSEGTETAFAFDNNELSKHFYGSKL